MSTLMFWNKQNGSNQSNEMKNGKKNWLHSPDLLVNAHVAFQVKVPIVYFVPNEVYKSSNDFYDSF